MCSVPYKPYQAPKNARKITLLALAGAVVIIAGVFVLRSWLNSREAKPVAVFEQVSEPNMMPAPEVPGTALPSVQTAQNGQPGGPSATAVSNGSNAVMGAEIASLLSMGKADIAAGQVIKARDELNDALRMLTGKPGEMETKAMLADLSQTWLFTKDVLKNDSLCSTYTVKPGENLTAIANKYRISYELLMELNNMTKASALKSGQHLKVINGPFHAILSKSNFMIDVYLQNTYVRSFKAGIGKDGHDTPTGLWRVSSGGKMIKPKWTDPDTGKVFEGTSPDYPLGARWIALDGLEGNAKGRTGFAIHGTNEPQTVGTKSSRGCVRLHDGDVILMYKLLVPINSEVRVVD